MKYPNTRLHNIKADEALIAAYKKKMRIRSAMYLIIAVCLSIVFVRFLDDIHYNNLIIRANSQTAVVQNQLTNEHYDIGFLIKHNPTTLNCYDLHSTYARGLCRTHNGVNNN